MRDMLIEILKKRDWLRYLIADINIERLADILLEAGVIVPPVKVGQTVYIIDHIFANPAPIERKVRSIEYTGRGFNFTVETLTRWYEYDIGVGVFLTKEAAEQALAERGADNGV